MEVKVLNSKLVKPAHDTAAAGVPKYVPLSVFDRVTCQMPMTIIFTFTASSPSMAAMEEGLVAALTRYRAFAGQLGEGPDGKPAVLLNDRGARLVDAAVPDADLADVAGEPTPELLKLFDLWANSNKLHPYLEVELEEVVLIQLTRFRCGSLAVGFTSNHVVADGHATSDFLVAWCRAARGHRPMGLTPVYYHREKLFRPRSPSRVEYDHGSREYHRPPSPAVEYYDAYAASNIVIHRAHLTKDFIVELRAKASEGRVVSFSRFETIVAHVWHAMTRARGLGDGDPSQVSTIRISVDGRCRLDPETSLAGYFGNLVLWAFPRATVGDLLTQPLRHVAQAIHDEVARVADAAYFQSFVDYACSGAVEEEGLAPSNVLCPDMEVDSWLTFPFYELDFGTGRPSRVTPSYFTSEGVMYLAPSNLGDGSVDAFVLLDLA
uniref:Uncharacterized protein n=1 Tax=Avena sativa TaxID=4498 RepID=A0ACD5ZJB3_AVESA